MVNYVNIARECGVDSKSVKEYYQILVSTYYRYTKLIRTIGLKVLILNQNAQKDLEKAR